MRMFVSHETSGEVGGMSHEGEMQVDEEMIE